MPVDRRTIGLRIKERRVGLGMLQQDVADAAGVHLRAFGKIERGEVTPHLQTCGLLEGALRLVPGSLAAAYQTGTELTPLSTPRQALPDVLPADWKDGAPDLTAVVRDPAAAAELQEWFENAMRQMYERGRQAQEALQHERLIPGTERGPRA
ncbi:helix-turn-helix transcriptional regulator [Longispora sp. NPDC051575]|uniref:helix-turn-helix domain-containing protein n=1 Tax=Longispora sp. NPDC051575 TaxID=3154943 RepID=UPI0034302536